MKEARREYNAPSTARLFVGPRERRGFSSMARRYAASRTLNPPKNMRWPSEGMSPMSFMHSSFMTIATGQKHNHAPRQVLGSDTWHAICEARHVVVPEPSSHFRLTGPLPSRPCP